MVGADFTPEGIAFVNSGEPPEFDIQKAVVIRFFAEEGINYTIEGTADFSIWTEAVSGIAGHGRVEKIFVETGNAQRFFRLKPN